MAYDIDAFINAGLIPMPCDLENSKPAYGFSQQPWYDAPPTKNEIRAVWARYGAHATGVGLITGHDIELIDVDTKNDPTKTIADKFFESIKQEDAALFERLCICSTRSGGRHIWIRLSEGHDVRGNTALAQIEYTEADQFALATDRTNGVIVETRGKGGFGFCHPTKGYDVLQGDIFNMPVLTDEERYLIWDIARSFNTYVKPIEYIPNERQGRSDDKPGADYSARVSIQEVVNLLESAGWTFLRNRGNTVYLNRPGAPHKHTSAIILQDKRLFVNYSTSIPEFMDGKGYSFWRVYAITKHAGDFSAAAKALASDGYGKQPERPVTATQTPSVPDDVLKKYAHLRFDIDNKPDFDFDFWVIEPGKTPLATPKRYGVGFPGALLPIVGKQKSRKSTVLTAIIAAALMGSEACRFWFEKPKKVLWFDTEQPEFYFWKTQWRIVVQAHGYSENLHSYWFRKMSPKERQLGISDLVQAIKPDVLVIDGINDLFLSMNKEEIVNEVINDWLMGIADKGITVFVVLHLNKGDNNMAGWVGTVLGKKSDGTIQVEPEGPYEVLVKMRDARTEPFNAYTLRTDPGMHGILYDPEYPVPEYNYGMAIEDDRGNAIQPGTKPDDTYETPMDENEEKAPNTDDLPF